jgi:hypothetical protein
MLPDGAFISSLEVPWKINRRRRIHMNPATDFRPEAAEQKSPPTETRPGTKPKKRLRQSPQDPADDLARGVLPGSPILFNVQHRKNH